jgi:hypothetical protein
MADARAANEHGYRPDRAPRRRRNRPLKVHKTVHLDVGMLNELVRRAEADNLSFSAVINVLLEEALRAGVEHEHGAILQQVVVRALDQRLWRVEALIRRTAVDAAQAKKLAYAAFTQATGVDLELARTVRDRARRDAWSDLHAALPEEFPMDEPAAGGA